MSRIGFFLHTMMIFRSYSDHTFSIQSKDPVIFSGKIRFNLDPLGRFSDSQMLDVLEKVN